VRDGAARRRGSGQLEAEILAVLWAGDDPLTPGQVHRMLDAGLAYTTVVTCLSRLHDKGVLTRRRVGRAYAYRPVADQPGLAARRMRQVLDAEHDRQVTLSRFVSELSAEDERVLRAVLGPDGGPDLRDDDDQSAAGDLG
jgi:predicted transcriptional regulator